MDIYEIVTVNNCPICGGDSCLEEDNGACYCICSQCGSHSMLIDYNNEKQRVEAARQTIELWNKGKVIAEGNGE